VFRRPAGSSLVDLGAWAALVLGVDAGPGSPELCRPLEARPLVFALVPGAKLAVALRIALTAPDSDVSQVSAEVHASGAGSAVALPPDASTLAERAVDTLLEPLRGLGGETTTARVEVEVRCDVASPGAAPAPKP
jgi:hypothetical protein